MEELGAQLADIAKKHGKAMAVEILAEALVPALEQAAAKTETPIDDTILALLKEPLKVELIKLIEGL